MKIQVQIKNVYGKETIYPACETSKKLAELIKQKTLTNSDIKKIKEIGFEIEVIQEVTKL